MANTKTKRSTMEISEDIASVLERVDPGCYPDTEHAGTVDFLNRALNGKTFITTERFLADIRRQAHQKGLAQEMNPLIKEARILLGIPLRRTKPRANHPGIGR